MKNLFFLLILFIVPIVVISQVPQKIDFQAIARDAEGDVMSNENISVRITILKNSANGTLAYQEKHNVSTDRYGLFVLHLGDGQALQNQFNKINWSSGSHFVKVEVDPAAGSSYINMGTLEMMSVPFALYAENTGNVDDADADPSNELQKLSLSGTNLTLSDGGGTITLPSAGGGDNWGTQSIVSDATLDGKGTPAAPLNIARQGADNNQILKWNGSTWIPSNDAVNDADANPSNEIQLLSLSSNKLSISDGNTITLPGGSGFSGSWNDLTNIPSGFADNKDDVRDSDSDPNNEIQELDNAGFYGNAISISGGNEVELFNGAITSSGDRVAINSQTSYQGRFTVFGENEAGINVKTTGSSRPAIVAHSDSDHGYAGRFVTNGNNSVGISLESAGEGLKSYADDIAIYGRTWSNGETSILGYSTEDKGRGVKGEVLGTSGIGVWGLATGDGSTGVWGEGAKWDFYAAGPGTNYGGASSIRWKRNIRPISNALDKVMSMRGVYFDWDKEHGGGHDMGMIAEEVGKVVPEIVQFESNGIDASGMDYGKLTPILLEAIKAQQQIIEDLQQRITILEGEKPENK